MIWEILPMLGALLILAGSEVLLMVRRNRAFLRREGITVVRRRRPGRSRWTRGYGTWVNDTFTFQHPASVRTKPPMTVRDVVALQPTDSDRVKLGPHPVIVRLIGDGTHIDLADVSNRELDLVGPFVVEAIEREPVPSVGLQSLRRPPRCDSV